jgi:hypothetical protein
MTAAYIPHEIRTAEISQQSYSRVALAESL